MGCNKPSIKSFGVSASKSVMLPLMLVKDRLFRCSRLHITKVVNNTSVMIFSCFIDWSKCMIDFMGDSQLLPIHGLRGGLNLHSVYIVIRKCWNIFWSKMLDFFKFNHYSDKLCSVAWLHCFCVTSSRDETAKWKDKWICW